jgi:hypothetical protein
LASTSDYSFCLPDPFAHAKGSVLLQRKEVMKQRDSGLSIGFY